MPGKLQVYEKNSLYYKLKYKELPKHIEVAGELAVLIRYWGAIQQNPQCLWQLVFFIIYPPASKKNLQYYIIIQKTLVIPACKKVLKLVWSSLLAGIYILVRRNAVKAGGGWNPPGEDYDSFFS